MELACRTLFHSPTIEMPNSYLKILENMPKICQQQDKSAWNRKLCSTWPPVVSIPPFATHIHLYIYLCACLHILLCSCKFIASECNAHCDSPALAWGENKRHSKFENCSDCDWTATVFFDCISMLLRFDQLHYKTQKQKKHRQRERRKRTNGRTEKPKTKIS